MQNQSFHNLFLSLLIQPHSLMLCAWWDLHATVVLHYGLWVIVLHLHDFSLWIKLVLAIAFI